MAKSVGSSAANAAALVLQVLTLVLGDLLPASAADDSCSKFKWPVEVESQWFADDKPKIEVGPVGSVSELPLQALKLTLAPPDKVALVSQPKRKPAEGSGNAVLTIGLIPAEGTYQVTLSDEAWIEFIKDGIPVPSTEFSGVKGCASVRKSVRFTLKRGPAVIQITGAPSLQLTAAIRRLQ